MGSLWVEVTPTRSFCFPFFCLRMPWKCDKPILTHRIVRKITSGWEISVSRNHKMDGNPLTDRDSRGGHSLEHSKRLIRWREYSDFPGEAESSEQKKGIWRKPKIRLMRLLYTYPWVERGKKELGIFPGKNKKSKTTKAQRVISWIKRRHYLG